jgi:FkbM family methyltransferase
MFLPFKKQLKSVYFRVRRDWVTGHQYYLWNGTRIYVRSPEDCQRPKYLKYAMEEIYFKHYGPKDGDCVVDFGAGFGEEAVELARRSPALSYVGVEIQPWVYECLALTLAQLPPNFRPYGLAVGPMQSVGIAPTRAGIDASAVGEGQVPVEAVTWEAFVRRHGIGRIDLLKMNIEGGEALLLDHVDLGMVDRVIVSTHDFRADRGDGEQFRTRAQVERRLGERGFALTPIGGREDWMRSWIYAERPGG